MNDYSIAQKSLQEERKAVKDYQDRLKIAKTAKLKHALNHALGEEKEHAKMFSEAVVNKARSMV